MTLRSLLFVTLICCSFLSFGKGEKSQPTVTTASLQTEIIHQLDVSRKAIEQKEWGLVFNSFMRLGKAYEEVQDLASALNAYQNAQSYALMLQDDSKAAQAILRQASVLLANEDFAAADQLIGKAYRYFPASTSPIDSALAFTLSGDIAYGRNNIGDAVNAYNQAMTAWISAEAYLEAAEQSLTIGNINASIGDYESARLFFQNAIGLFDQLGNQTGVATALTGIGSTYAEEKEWDLSEKWMLPAQELLATSKDTIAIANWGVLAAKLFFAKEHSAKAKQQGEATFALLQNMKPSSKSIEMMQKLSQLLTEYEVLGLATLVSNATLDAHQVWVQHQKQQQLATQQAQFQLQLAENAYHEQIEALESEQTHQRFVRTVLFFCLGIVVLISGLLYWMFSRQKKFTKILEKKNAAIDRQNQELEIQHNKLEVVNNQLELVNNRLLNEIAEREALENTSFARDKFLATVSQEMRTPLNSLIGLSYMLLEENPDDAQRKHLQELMFAANHITVFINDILDFSKIEAGKLTIEKRSFFVRNALKDLQADWAVRSASAKYPINIETNGKLPDQVIGDAGRLRQVLLGVMDYLVVQGEPGDIKVNTSVKEIEGQTIWIEFSMRLQTWFGEANFESLFQGYNLYFEENSGDYQRQKMGITLTRRLIELQNGKLQVRTTNNQPEISFLLPFQKVANPKNKDTVNLNSYEIEDLLLGRSVLLVEDNRINQLVVRQLLEKNGISVTVAENGIEGLEVFNRQNFDLILMDIQMPKMDGYRTTAEIRKHPNDQKSGIPIIALTASAFLSESEKAKLFGMNGHLGKPFSPQDLLEIIALTVKNKKAPKRMDRT